MVLALLHQLVRNSRCFIYSFDFPLLIVYFCLGVADDIVVLRNQVEQLARVLPVAFKLFRSIVRYSDSNKGSARSSEFKNSLIKMSGLVSGKARCCVLDILLPRDVVIGAHIFKREWSWLSKDLLDIDDVDDSRNGACCCGMFNLFAWVTHF